MDICPPDDLHKPLADLFSIDGWLLEQPSSKVAALWEWPYVSCVIWLTQIMLRNSLKVQAFKQLRTEK